MWVTSDIYQHFVANQDEWVRGSKNVKLAHCTVLLLGALGSGHRNYVNLSFTVVDKSKRIHITQMNREFFLTTPVITQ